MNLSGTYQTISGYKNLYVNNNSRIEYNDGEIESYILDCVSKYNSTEPYSDWEKMIKDWPSEYHLSWVRTNILAPLDLKPTDRVLELGGGTGMLTHYLASRVKEVISYEGTLLRGQCIAARCAAFDNVTTVVSEFSKANFIQKYGEASFDVITLIGVLEYTNKYYATDDPVKDLLDICHALLKPDGLLIIAIENRLGLKYLLGWEEDHIGKAYYGIEDLYKQGDAITYAHDELANILEQSSFTHHKFLYPFPDYKLPGIILNPLNRSLPARQKELFCNLLYQIDFRNYSGKNSPSVNAGQAIQSIIENNLLSDLSNSFLVIASKKEIIAENDTKNRQPVALYFSSERRYDYANTIRFFDNGKNIELKKSSLINKNKMPPADAVITQTLFQDNLQDITEGISLGRAMETAYLKKDQVVFEKYLLQWIDFLKQNIAKHRRSEFDLMPFNVVITQNGILKAIDVKEWICIYTFNLEAVVARLFMLNTSYAAFILEKHVKISYDVLNAILAKCRLGLLNKEDYDHLNRLHEFSSHNVMSKKYPDKTEPSLINTTSKHTLKKLSNKLIARSKKVLTKR